MPGINDRRQLLRREEDRELFAHIEHIRESLDRIESAIQDHGTRIGLLEVFAGRTKLVGAVGLVLIAPLTAFGLNAVLKVF